MFFVQRVIYSRDQVNAPTLHPPETVHLFKKHAEIGEYNKRLPLSLVQKVKILLGNAKDPPESFRCASDFRADIIDERERNSKLFNGLVIYLQGLVVRDGPSYQLTEL